MTNEQKFARVERVLAEAGGLYTFADIISLVQSGAMQSFTYGDSWAVTQVTDYPRRRAVDIVLAVGDMEECLELERQISAFAVENNATVLVAVGRDGWSGKMQPGWKRSGTRFVKEI